MFVAVENGFERILHSARTLRKDARTMLASTTLEVFISAFFQSYKKAVIKVDVEHDRSQLQHR